MQIGAPALPMLNQGVEKNPGVRGERRLVRDRPPLFRPRRSSRFGRYGSPEPSRAGVVLLERDLPSSRVPIEQAVRRLAAHLLAAHSPNNEELPNHPGIGVEATYQGESGETAVSADQVPATIRVAEVQRQASPLVETFRIRHGPAVLGEIVHVQLPQSLNSRSMILGDEFQGDVIWHVPIVASETRREAFGVMPIGTDIARSRRGIKNDSEGLSAIAGGHSVSCTPARVVTCACTGSVRSTV